jgi:hypothetical protein
MMFSLCFDGYNTMRYSLITPKLNITIFMSVKKLHIKQLYKWLEFMYVMSEGSKLTD